MATCISIVASDNAQACKNKVEEVLRRYTVTRVESIEEALGAIWEMNAMPKPHLFITNLHKLEPDGDENIQIIDEMLNLSVLTMDSDEMIERNGKMQLGFYLYVVEDLSMSDLNIILGNSKGASVSEASSSRSVLSSSSLTNENPADNNINGKKKRRCIWTDEMKKKFEDAFQEIENMGQKPVPSKIRKHMGVPGLTRESVASYLQVYLRNKTPACATPSTMIPPILLQVASGVMLPRMFSPISYDLSSLPTLEATGMFSDHPTGYDDLSSFLPALEAPAGNSFSERTMPANNIMHAPMPEMPQNFDQEYRQTYN